MVVQYAAVRQILYGFSAYRLLTGYAYEYDVQLDVMQGIVI